MDLIFFLSLESRISALGCLVILSSKASIWDFKSLISAFRLLNFLASLESLFHLCLSCILVKGPSNSGCLTSVCGSFCSSQVNICGGRFGSQVDIHEVGTVGVVVEVSVVSGPDVHYLGEGLLTQLFFLNKNNLSIYTLS